MPRALTWLYRITLASFATYGLYHVAISSNISSDIEITHLHAGFALSTAMAVACIVLAVKATRQRAEYIRRPTFITYHVVPFTFSLITGAISVITLVYNLCYVRWENIVGADLFSFFSNLHNGTISLSIAMALMPATYYAWKSLLKSLDSCKSQEGLNAVYMILIISSALAELMLLAHALGDFVKG
jgi:hypothetical protein